MNDQSEFASSILHAIDGKLEQNQIEKLIEKPKNPDHGDLAFPCFSLAKMERKAPHLIAQELRSNITSSLFEKVEAAGGYVNAFLNKNTVARQVLSEIIQKKSAYGTQNIGNQGVVTIDMSSPNIAKPFSMGHLRSTVIGNSLALILEKCGFQPIKINYLGDWGTQFGKLIAAYKMWGNEQQVNEDPIKELLKLYIKFHEEAETNAELDEKGRKWFKRLEDGDEEALNLWKWFKEASLNEFNRIYKLLNIEFDSYNGEAYYNEKMDDTVKLLQKKGLLTESDQALVVELSDADLPPCLIKKSDGATLYATRDLTAAIDRKQRYDFVQSLYVVGHEQSLHFQQVIGVLKKMGFSWATSMTHVPFGMVLKDGKKMSTRKGKVVLLEDVLKESIEMAYQNISVKNPDLPDKETVAKQVGVGAIIFHDLKNDRMNDMDFSLKDMLRFEGETGPYVQYTNARARSVLRKGRYTPDETFAESFACTNKEWEIITLLKEFPDVIRRAQEQLDPSQIARYAISLARSFNKYYGHVKILKQDDCIKQRLTMVHAVTIVLQESLRLLGIDAPEEM
ncbi:arginyl-tRNA synthetase [Melghiribacillus thermohalophilus]|uniref:Arginine--tRNA ligase n=1 Tax=Melghiribacillus thermohalophilus TaxID=1324956 RepID=A0A4R3MPY5_9BACI|nr:arginine--tRNA ligase [Melghiribacillus thermohalophilus]TCT17539.1 arginyl-tRNA synthetase [Melghiribacillus thermohalophilus]